jgi:CheY-like chemotaxis protein
MPKDILIVDDDTLVCDSLKEMLTLEGYSVDAVWSAPAALTKVKEGWLQPHPLRHPDARHERP